MTHRAAVIFGVLILVLMLGMLSFSILGNVSQSIGLVFALVLGPLNVILVLSFTIHVWNRAESLGIKKWPWIFAFFLCSFVALPVFWFKHVWPNRVVA